jgi:CheY-like chemotaxis protein
MAPAAPGAVYGVPALDGARHVVAFSVRDTGIGIPDGKLAMIFEAFQQADGTTSRKYGGTGLGLSISKELSRMLGGRIDVTSAVGEGSEFTLFLPDVLPAVTATARSSARADAISGGVLSLGSAALRGADIGFGGDRGFGGAGSGRGPADDPRPSRGTPVLRSSGGGGARPVPVLDGVTVLIVDDDVRNVFALTSALELHGLTVLYADNGHEGIRLLTEHPDIDVVLMDAMMPDIDGNETTRRIRALPQGRDLPVVFLTAKAMPGDRESSLAAGATDYVTKPVDLDELLVLMASWVGTRAGAVS